MLTLFHTRLKEKHVITATENKIDQLISRIVGSYYTDSASEHASDIIIAGRMIAGCIRNLLIMHLVHLSSSRGTSNKTSFSMNTTIDPLFEERDLVLKHVVHTIALVDIIQRQMNQFAQHEELIQKAAYEYRNYDLTQLNLADDAPLMKKKFELQTSIKHWQRTLHDHLSLPFLKTYKWFNARVKRYMEINGQSIELLIKDTLDSIMKVYGIVQTSDRNEREYVTKQQEEQNAIKMWLESMDIQPERTFRAICTKTTSEQDSIAQVLFFDQHLFTEMKSKYEATTQKKTVKKGKKKKEEQVTIAPMIQEVTPPTLLEDDFYKPFSIDDIS
jgi:hypothetical protein